MRLWFMCLILTLATGAENYWDKRLWLACVYICLWESIKWVNVCVLWYTTRYLYYIDWVK